ncbi:GNAT family N-acetyltransferase [Bacillus carboniphilus]|uniref:Lysine N-acyltransferase MbtK n=1 Tax=Bacillus carboniphilus TaxID=86663 RepID=A0ABY9JUS6_9BACI|nr:GNAT family N-acetyltransferase [Bacillus carboniphilus]WLR43137.1 GNAT family N-acetyltransferase [Bacillus carboniphilus]
MLSFRRVDFEKDVKRLHGWHHQPHVIPFWNQNFTFEKYADFLTKLLDDQHQTLWIGMVHEESMSYFETYWAKDDVLGKHYDWNEFDQGIHLLIGEPSFLGKGYAAPFVSKMVEQLFQEERTSRIVTEPDIRNEKMIHIFKKVGFKPYKELQLPDKKALMMICERSDFKKVVES